MHIWSYLATRIGGEAAFTAAADRTGSFSDEAFVQAGVELKKLIDMEPFQDGFLGATHDEMQATFGNGKAAMELSGQWAPSVQAANSADQVGVANLGMFNFPLLREALVMLPMLSAAEMDSLSVRTRNLRLLILLNS